MAARFYVREGLARAMIGSTIELPPAVTHHATRVVRMGVGDAITLFDGTGGEYEAQLVGVDRRGAHARIDRFSPVERESSLSVTLVLAIVASDAMDYAVRKAVELGVHAIIPVVTSRSAPMPPGPRADKRVAHWNEIAIAACEQCGRNRVPEVSAPINLGDYAPADDEKLFVCAPEDAAAIGSASAERSCAVAIGPEGGFTRVETEALDRRGATRVSLGPRILRTETAVCAALAVLQARSGDLR
ncbi:MAG TPA: 16S rRNA (uracil(1498)-N(3))-methyltransferase [Casimicrobiaceae bacterium]|nr:16S rRNA (uracil(1498)-N(3))-methyltransferase [Casimicrobiaceae bacterium]